MLRHNLLMLQSAVRHFRQTAGLTLNVKSLQQRLQYSHTAYRQFDAPSNDAYHRPPVAIPTHISLQKIARKCCQQLHHHPHPIRSMRTSSSSNSSSRHSISVSKCWSCSVPQSGVQPIATGIFCSECGTIQELPERSSDEYFALFGLERAFALDAAALTCHFRQLQSLVHPDKFSKRSEREQQLSADWSSLVNSAYKTLLAPIRRGEYILRQLGITVPEGNTSVASAFLMEMMERNEEVDDAHSAVDLAALLQKVQDDLREVVAKLDASLLAGNLDTALQDVITLRYLVSLENSIKTKAARLGGVE